MTSIFTFVALHYCIIVLSKNLYRAMFHLPVRLRSIIFSVTSIIHFCLTTRSTAGKTYCGEPVRIRFV